METNTEKSFRDKWENNFDLAFDETSREGSDVFNWILNRNGFLTGGSFRNYLSSKTRILDAGCGNGRVTALLRSYSDPEQTEVVGFDLAAAHVAKKNLSNYQNIRIEPGDLLGDLSGFGKFDFVYCQEVLHHTSDPERAFQNLCSVLSPNGEIAIYVYKLKAPAREFVDDYVRSKVAHLDYEKAMSVCEQFTKLGRCLAEQNLTIKVPAVDILGIQKGEYDLQRFIYHFFVKCFWNPTMSLKDNTAVNYDWYHPQLCSRHTVEEIRGWFKRAGLDIEHEYVDFYGITMRGRRAES